MNAAKCKVLVSECWADPTAVMAEGVEVEVVEDFCYLGSHISKNGNCNKECSTRIGKASSVFGRLKSIWSNKNISLEIKVRLYESLVLSTSFFTLSFHEIPSSLRWNLRWAASSFFICVTDSVRHLVRTAVDSSELWPLSVTQMKKLEAAHHKFQ